MNKIKVTSVLSFLLAILMFTGTAIAGDKDKDDDDEDEYKDKHRKTLKIIQVTVDVDSAELYIHGKNLQRKNRIPRVKLAGNELVVSSVTNELIIASLQPGTLAGDYLLMVSSGRGETKRDTYDLTIGAVGPVGPQGPQGEIGLTGAQGMKGETGATGPVGAVGPMGPRGFTGPQGLAGDTGAVGAVGSQGPLGPVGPAGPEGPQGPAGTSFSVTLGNTVLTNPVGGAGGSPFSLNCPSGQIAVGLSVRAGNNIDQIRLRCAPITNVGVNAYSLFAQTGGISLSAAAGGNGGTASTLACPGTFGLKGVSGRVGNGGSGVIDQIRGNCRKLLSTASVNTLTRGRALSGSVTFALTCPGDTVVTGLRGRAGSLIDRIQLACR